MHLAAMPGRVVPPGLARRQRGVVLIVALIFLLLLTILAISASGRSLLQERMAGGLRNAQLAQMSAETALRGAEWKLWSNTNSVAATPLLCGSGVLAGSCYKYDPGNGAVYGPQGTVTLFRTSQTWTATGAATYMGPAGGTDYTKPPAGADTAQLAKNPVYIIEDLGVELPPNSGTQRESGATGPGTGGTSDTSRHIYRITARAVGGNENTVRVLESTFAAKGN
jgi:type IV pilus assembly protein PilX